MAHQQADMLSNLLGSGGQGQGSPFFSSYGSARNAYGAVNPTMPTVQDETKPEALPVKGPGIAGGQVANKPTGGSAGTLPAEPEPPFSGGPMPPGAGVPDDFVPVSPSSGTSLRAALANLSGIKPKPVRPSPQQLFQNAEAAIAPMANIGGMGPASFDYSEIMKLAPLMLRGMR